MHKGNDKNHRDGSQGTGIVVPYNGNISTMKWKLKSDSDFSGFNFEYDDCNRLTGSVFNETVFE